MIPIESKIPHNLGQEPAVERMHQMLASLPDRFPQQVHQVQLSLKDHRVQVSFAAYGYVVEWEAEVYADSVLLHGRIPDAARPFKNKIEQAIAARVEATLTAQASRAA